MRDTVDGLRPNICAEAGLRDVEQRRGAQHRAGQDTPGFGFAVGRCTRHNSLQKQFRLFAFYRNSILQATPALERLNHRREQFPAWNMSAAASAPPQAADMRELRRSL